MQWLGVMLIAPAISGYGAGLALGHTSVAPAAPAAALEIYLYPGPAVAALQFDLLFDPAALDVTTLVRGTALIDAQKTLSFNVIDDGHVRVLVAGLNQNTIAAGPICTVEIGVNTPAPGAHRMALSGVVLSTPAGQGVPALVYDGGVVVGPSPFHDADTDLDFSVSDVELNRVIALYTAGAHRCTAATHDGYEGGNGSSACGAHDSDYQGGANWRIDFGEMIRLIQLSNLGKYRNDASTEDGFSPDPIGNGATP